MKKIVLFLICASNMLNGNAQNVFTDDFSNFNVTKIDGQNGWSTSTPSLGNGSGGCFSIGCNVQIVTKVMNFPNFTSCSQALNPIDGVLATGDGPGKSIGTVVNSGSLYVAMLVNFTEPAASTSPNANKQVIRFMDNGFGTASRIYIQRFGAGAFKVGIDKNGSAASFSSSTYAYGVDHLIILKYKFNTSSSTDDEAAVFINPDLSVPEPTATVSLTGTSDATSITRVVCPWNVTSLIPAGYIGVVSVAKDWSQSSLPIANISNTQLIKIQNNKANFKWVVDNDKDIKSFIVEQSTDRISFKSVATIDIDGNKTYNVAIDLLNGINYIRLVVINKNGNREIGNIFSVKSGAYIVKDIYLSPNPTNSILNIAFTATANKKITIQVLDMFGKCILQNNKVVDAGENIMSLDIAALKAGNYLTKIVTSEGEIQIAKFVKQ